jgi:hypothetical protein
MTGLRSYPRFGEAIHDLGHIQTLSDEPEIVLRVSGRTLYIIQNLAAAEAGFNTRYAVSQVEAGYIPVDPGDDEWPTYIETVNQLGVETVPIPYTWLEESPFGNIVQENELDLSVNHAGYLIDPVTGLLHYEAYLSVQNAGTSGYPISLTDWVSLPASITPMGVFTILRNAGVWHSGVLMPQWLGASYVFLHTDGAASVLGVNPVFALDPADLLYFSGSYRVG